MTADQDIQAERTRMVLAQVPAAVLVTVVNASLLAGLLFALEGNRRALGWLAAMAAVAGLRLVLWAAYRRAAPPPVRAGRWAAANAAAAGLSGLLWGGGAVLVGAQAEAYRLLWIFVTGGMCTGAAALHYAHLPTVLAFILPACLPVAAALAAEGSPQGVTAAAMILVFLAALGLTAERSSCQFGRHLRTRFELAERTAALDAANARLRAEMEERRMAEAALRQAQKMEALGQLTGGIAHDINNVLQVVSGAAALIGQRAEDAAAVRRRARMIADAVERGAAITRRLLTFARRGELRAEVVDPAGLLQGLREILAPAFGARIAIRVEAEPGLPPLLADREQLETALVNLAVNARDAMPEGGVLTLAAAMERVAEGAAAPPGPAPGRYIRLSVRDTGEGMDAETLARAAEPFFTTKPAGKGTGLGLSMAKGLAEQSGGAFAIESAPGRGTTVTLWFPLAEAAAAPAAAPQAAAAAPHRSIGTPRVLLVEDEAAVRETLAAELAAAGHIVLTAADGAEALARLDAGEAVDALVTDLAMPGLDGLAVIRAARARRPGLPAMLLTGYAGDAAALATDGAEGGPFALLRKPVSGAEIADRIAMLLEAAASRAAGGGGGRARDADSGMHPELRRSG